MNPRIGDTLTGIAIIVLVIGALYGFVLLVQDILARL